MNINNMKILCIEYNAVYNGHIIWIMPLNYLMLTCTMIKDGGNEMRFCDCNIQMTEKRCTFVIATCRLQVFNIICGISRL